MGIELVTSVTSVSIHNTGMNILVYAVHVFAFILKRCATVQSGLIKLEGT